MRLTVLNTTRRVVAPTLPVLFRTFETVAVETPVAFATSRIVTFMIRGYSSDTTRNMHGNAGSVARTGTSRSVTQEKHLDNEMSTMIFPSIGTFRLSG